MDPGSTQNFRIGDRIVSPFTGDVKSPAGTTRITPKVMSVLICLAKRDGEVVTRNELMNEVWGRVVVSDESLTRCISELRSALGDDRKSPKYVQTIPKVGYRFLQPIVASGQPEVRSRPGGNEGGQRRVYDRRRGDDNRMPGPEPADQDTEQIGAAPEKDFHVQLQILAYVELAKESGTPLVASHGSGYRVLQQAGRSVLLSIQNPEAINQFFENPIEILRGGISCGDVIFSRGLPTGHTVNKARTLALSAQPNQLLVGAEVAAVWGSLPETLTSASEIEVIVKR